MSLHHRFIETKLKEISHLQQEINNILNSNKEMIDYSNKIKNLEGSQDSLVEIEEYYQENLIFLEESRQKLEKIKKEVLFVDPSLFDLMFNQKNNNNFELDENYVRSLVDVRRCI